MPLFSLLFFAVMAAAGLGKTIMQIFILLSFHELFHIGFALLFRYDITQLVIYPFGVGMFLDGMEHKHSLEEMTIAMAGLFSYVFSTPLIALCMQFNLISSVNYQWLHQINTSILLFNALPIYPLDGGRIVHALCHLFFPYTIARKMTLMLSFLLLVVFAVVNIQSLNMLVVVVVFLLIQQIEAWMHLLKYRRQFYLYRYLHSCAYPRKRHHHEDLFRNYENEIVIQDGVMSEQEWLDCWLKGKKDVNQELKEDFFC